MAATKDRKWPRLSPRPVRAAAGRQTDIHHFVVLPKRWIVERMFAWISHFRRLGKSFERYARKAAAFIRLAMIPIMLRRDHGKPFTVNRSFPERLLAVFRRHLLG
jgi:transposase